MTQPASTPTSTPPPLLSPERLAGARRPLERAMTLPAEAFTSPDVYAAEVERILERILQNKRNSNTSSSTSFTPRAHPPYAHEARTRRSIASSCIARVARRGIFRGLRA